MKLLDEFLKNWQVGKMYFKFTSKYQIDSAAAAKMILFKCEQLLKNLKIFYVSFVFLRPYVQLITIHIACNKMQVWSNGN